MLLGFRGAEGDPGGEEAGAGGTERSDGVGGLSLELMQMKNREAGMIETLRGRQRRRAGEPVEVVLNLGMDHAVWWDGDRTILAVRADEPEPYDERESNP